MSSLFWFLLTIFFIVIELISPMLISIWFAASSIILLIVSLFIENILIEWLIFTTLSVFFILISRPIYKKYLKGKITNTNVYSLIGKSYKLSSPIINGENGKIIIGDQIWNASSKLDIDEGEEVIIKEIIGTKLIVERKM